MLVDGVAEAPVRLLLNMTRSYDFGRYQATLNGVKIGGVMDFHNEETDNWEYHLLDFWPEPGNDTLRLQCTGKNAFSSGTGIGANSVRLRERRPRVAEFGYDPVLALAAYNVGFGHLEDARILAQGDGANPDMPYLTMPIDEYVAEANRQTFIIVQIESPEALEQVAKSQDALVTGGQQPQWVIEVRCRGAEQ